MPSAAHSSKIRFHCSTCGAPFAVAPELAGRRAVCKRCRNPLVVPNGPPPATAAAAPPVSAARDSGVRRRPTRRLAWICALAVALGAAGSVFLLAPYIKSHFVHTALARVVAQNEAALATLSPEAAAAWESAAVQTAGLIAELEGLAAEPDSAAVTDMLTFLRRQQEFLAAKTRLDQLHEAVQAAWETYRRRLWHPPGRAEQWPLYLEQTESLRRALQRQASGLKQAAAVAAERHAALVDAEQAAALRLSASQLSMGTYFGDNAERLQRVWAHAGAAISEELPESN